MTTIDTMGAEPRNAASETMEAVARFADDAERVQAEWQDWIAESFVRDDRRRLIAMPPQTPRRILNTICPGSR